MELPDWVADKMLTLKPTASLILVRLFRFGEQGPDRTVRWVEGLSLLVPGTHPKALADAASDLEAVGYIRTSPGTARPGRRGKPPKIVVADFEISDGIREQDRSTSTFIAKTEAYSEPESPRVRERVPSAAAAADPYYLRLVKVFQTEGVVDPETQVSAFGIRASLAAVSELRVRRRTGMAVNTQPRNLLCHFGEKYRANGAPDVPNPDLILADWDDPEGPPQRLRAVK